jgi:3-hydroxybutyryl-CoA dehydrogenase
MGGIDPGGLKENVMNADHISSVVVIGTGQMGPGIALVVNLAGWPVTLIGISPEETARGVQGYQTALNFLVEHGAVTSAEAVLAKNRLKTSLDIGDARFVDLVIEAIVEHLPTKQTLFQKLDAICPPATIITSNTSGLRISDIATRMECHPERAVTTHFWNPGHLMPLVEVIQGEKTSDETVQITAEFLKRCGKKPVIGRKDLPGQICNRLFQAVIREAIYLVQEEIATAEDVETAIKAGMGLRFPVYGPLEHLDATGLDLALAVQSSVLPSLCNATVPGELLRETVKQGNLGVKTGQGFYNWRERSVDELRLRRDLFLVERLKEARKSNL